MTVHDLSRVRPRPPIIQFDVLGDPSPQSGMKPQGRTRSGAVRLVSTGGVNLRSWRDSVALAARQAAATAHGYQLAGPVVAVVQFRHPMPASRSAAVKARGICPRSATPDLDKLQRALGDSLKAGGLIVDDGRVAAWYAAKVEVWQAWTGARVAVCGLDDLADLPSPTFVHDLMWGANP